MKKKNCLGALLAAMLMGTACPAMAQEAAQNTVRGFEGGSRSHQLEMTQRGGEVRVPFDLGENAANLAVEIDINEGSHFLRAAYDRAQGDVVLTPRPDARRANDREFELEIDVVDRKTKELVTGDYFLTGFITYDTVQTAEDGRHYSSGNGVLYDFGDGARDVTILAGEGVTLEISHMAGAVDLTLTKERNAALDYMFSRHEIEYLHFPSQPEFSGEVTVNVNSDAAYLYEYAGGELRRVRVLHVPGEGYTFTVRRLGTYLLTDDQLTEGAVDEEARRIR